jgi:Flp pilus assembly protein TadG
MDTDRKIASIRNQKGIALVYIAVALVAVFMLVGLAIDVGYMYVVKGQLQNAADAAALAAAVKLDGTTSFTQTAARSEAQRLANANVATKQPVQIFSNTTENTFAMDNDITFGLWDGSNYTAGATPFNAVQVRTRRTADTPDQAAAGPVSIFLGKVLGWNTMSAVSTSTGALQVRATSNITVCVPFCNLTGTTVLTVNTGSPTPGPTLISWSGLLQNTPASGMSALICSGTPFQDVCGKQINTTWATQGGTFRDFASVFYDRNMDAVNKGFDARGYYWQLDLPRVVNCDLGGSGTQEVTGYARVKIRAVCPSGGSGGGGACRPGYPPDPFGSFSSSIKLCNGAPNNSIVLTHVGCIDCGTNGFGLKPALVK